MYKYIVILVHPCMFWYILVYKKRLDSWTSAWYCPPRARYQRGSIYRDKQLHNMYIPWCTMLYQCIPVCSDIYWFTISAWTPEKARGAARATRGIRRVVCTSMTDNRGVVCTSTTNTGLFYTGYAIVWTASDRLVQVMVILRIPR